MGIISWASTAGVFLIPLSESSGVATGNQTVFMLFVSLPLIDIIVDAGGRVPCNIVVYVWWPNLNELTIIIVKWSWYAVQLCVKPTMQSLRN